jgi:APA family basic amino acid/polyamine antiporter
MVVGSIGIMVVAGFSTGNGSWSGLVARAEPGSNWWVALLQVTYAYAGWNAAAYIAGEVRDPGKNLPRAILGGTLFVTVVYLLINALFFYALPQAEWEPAIAVGQLAAEQLFGLRGSLAVTSIIALAMFGSVSAMTAVGPRIYFAMARDGVAPRFLGRISDQGHVPVAAIVAQGVLAAALALTGAFETLLIYIGSSLLLFNGLTVVTLFVFRRREGVAARRMEAVAGTEDGAGEIFRTPLHPLPALIFLGVTIAAWVNGLLGAPVPTGAALATLALGGGVYAIGIHRSWFTT